MHDPSSSIRPDTAIEASPFSPEGASGRVGRLVTHRPVLTTFLLALAARLLVAITTRLFFDGFLFGDEEFFAQIASDMARGDTAHWGGYEHSLGRSMGAFLYVLAGAYQLFGLGSFAGQAVVALLGAGTAAAVAALALQVLPVRESLGAGGLVALLPSQVLFSALTLRDAASWLLLSLAAVFIAKGNAVRGSVAAAYGVVVVVLLTVLAFVRVHTFIASTVALAIASWFAADGPRWLRGMTMTVVAALMPAVLGYGVFGAAFLRNSPDFEIRRVANAQHADTAVVQAPATKPPSGEGSEVASPAVERDVDGTEREYLPDGIVVERLTDETVRVYQRGLVKERLPTGVTRTYPGEPPPYHLPRPFIAEPSAGAVTREFMYLPRGLVVFLLEPLPWRTGSIAVRLGQLESLVWYPLLALSLVGALRLRRRLSTAAFPVLIVGLLSVGYGMAEGNYGTAFRHRGEIVWAVAFLAAAGAPYGGAERASGLDESSVERWVRMGPV